MTYQPNIPLHIYLASESYLDTLADREYEPLRLSEKDLYENFGDEGIEIAKEQLQYYNTKIADYKKRQIEYMEHAYTKFQYSKANLMIDIWQGWNEDLLEDYNREIKRLERFINAATRKAHSGEIGPDEITEAKNFDMTSLVEINRSGFALCPKHSERHASAKFYKDRNRLHCFGGCGSMDTIDVCMAQNEGVDFIQAVKIILGR